MDLCHSVSSRSPAYTSAVTVAHLIRNIEQLKNKDKLISQLEKDLGQQWVAAHLAALERECSEGARGYAMSAPSHPLSPLPEACYDPSFYPWDPTSTPATGGVEEAKPNAVESNTPGKEDLLKRLRDDKDKKKELVEKCRTYLQRIKELTAQNRAYKDSSEKVLQENKKMQELHEHSKLRVLQLTRNLSEAQAEKTNLERQIEKVEELRQQMMEDKKTINALKQACNNKDRRIELMQHRKKKRQLAEKTMGVKETFFGYEEDTNSVDSEQSSSSMSQSTISDDDVWNEVLTAEETERNYQRLMMEHLRLQKSHTQLHSQCGHLQDPQREAMMKVTLQNDLFNAQCRIEKLEKLINEIGEGEVISLLKERETITAINNDNLEKAQYWEKEGRLLQHQLNKALEKCEDLEFQLMEFEQANEEKQNSSCEDSVQQFTSECHEQIDNLAEIDHQQRFIVLDMEQLRNDLVSLLKGKGRDADTALKRLDTLLENEKKRAESLESIAGELQMKVISLQKERDALYSQLSQTGVKQSKGENSAMVAARERQENMELKNEIAELSCSESKLLAEQICLNEQLEEWKTKCNCLMQQLDIFTKMRSQKKQSSPSPLKVDISEGVLCDSSPPTSFTTQLTRKSSKDRKSKPRSGDDPMVTKRRRSSKDVSDDSHSKLKIANSFVDGKDTDLQSIKNVNSNHNIQPVTESEDELEKVKNTLRTTEAQLHALKEEMFILQDQLKQLVIEKNSEAEADQQLLLEKLEILEAEKGLLCKENEALAQRLKQRIEEYQEELNPKVAELEDYCEDLQERLHASEMTERQAREKLKLMEQNIDDAECNEIAIREKYEDLLAREAEFKRQVQVLQRTGQELRDIVLDKDIAEQALRDKIDFLQKAEAAASKRIDELEAIERELREQLELRSNPKDSCQREQNKIQELKHQITFLETDNKALIARIAELEENEEILRENWRRVADEDFNRTQCLEEKVKMLDAMNRELKSKLADAQEYFVINTVNTSENSLAAELAQSRSKVRRAATFDDDFDIDDDSAGDSDSPETSQTDNEKKNLKDKLRQLERQLSDVAEEKNSKIESLQERIVSLKENETKLSETISELEMTERELRAKLALYESSEVTVEKMLKYQSKIEELRTSQESLLDQIESMENQGMTLQEQMQEMERTLRGKIVTLEVEMRGYKQRELKDAARIRELEKQEKELSQKLSQQAEKENGLYVKISSLMDELKKTKEELSTVKSMMLEKEDKVRKANLLEVSFLEKEMENGKKFASLSTKLRHKEEELRQKEASHEEEVALLRQELLEQETQKTQRIAFLENHFAHKEKDLQASILSLSEDVKLLTSERDECLLQIKELTDQITDLNDKDIVYNKELSILRHEITSNKSSDKEYEDTILNLQDSLDKEKQKVEETENKVILLEKELAKEKENAVIIENKILSVKQDIGEKMKNIELSFLEKEREYETNRKSLNKELVMKGERVKELEKELADKLQYMKELEAECAKLKSESALSENETLDKLADLGKVIAEKDEKFDELQKVLTDKETIVEDQIIVIKHQEAAQNELKNKVTYLNTQLMNEVTAREKAQSFLKQAEEREAKLSSEINDLKAQVEQLRLQLIEKLSELENRNKEICELSIELSNLRNSWINSQNELINFKEMSKEDEATFKDQILERDRKIENLKKELDIVQNEIKELKLDLLQREDVAKFHLERENILQEKEQEIKSLVVEKLQNEAQLKEHMRKNEHEQQLRETEIEKLKKELIEKNALLEKEVLVKNEKDAEVQLLLAEVRTLKQELEKSSHKQERINSENEKYQQQIQKLQETTKAQIAEIDVLQKKLVEQIDEIKNRSHEQADTQQLILSKNHELEQTRSELQKCLQEIQDCKNQSKIKVTEMSKDMKNLNMQFIEQKEEHRQLESKVANMELKLMDAENRYREIEAKCASLEMQLQESFVQTQQAQQIIQIKEEECQQLENKLKLKSSELHQEISNTQTQHENSKTEVNELKQKLDHLEKTNKEAENKLRMSDVKLKDIELKSVSMEAKLKENEDQKQCSSIQMSNLQSTFKSLQSRHNETETNLKQRENVVLELQKTNDEKNKTIETLQSEIRDIQLQHQGTKLDAERIESDRKIMCAQLDTLKGELETTKSALRKCEENCEIIQKKLHLSEEKLVEKDQSISELIVKINTLEKALQEKESFCRDSQSDFHSLEQQYKTLKTESDELRSTINYLQTLTKNSQMFGEQNEEKVKELNSILEQTRNELTNAHYKLAQSDTSYKNIVSQLEHFQRCVNSSQEEVNSLKENLKEAAERNKDFAVKNDRLKVDMEEKERNCNQLLAELKILKEQTKDLQQQLTESNASNISITHKLNEKEQQYLNTSADLSSFQKNIDFIVLQNQEKCSELENLCQRLQDEIRLKDSYFEKLKLSEAQLTSSLLHLQQENTSLKSKVTAADNSHLSDSDLSELIETNIIISGKLYQAETKLRENEKRVALLEQKLSDASSEKNDCIVKIGLLEGEKKQLQKEVKFISRDLERLKSDFAKSKEVSEKALKHVQAELVGKNDLIAKLEQEISILKISVAEIDLIKSQNLVLSKKNEDLLHSIDKQKKRSSETEIVKESEIFVSMVTDLHTELPHQGYSSDFVDGNVKIEKLVSEIESFKKADAESQEKLSNLNKLLKEMKEKETRMSERVCALEVREKELLEQIADIEVTVIVPLESENQELKDEINVVKQERDDAQARVNKWGDSDEDVESVHKSLEDSLIYRDELEKKVEILSNDVSKLEHDRDNLRKQIIDFESNDAEQFERIQFLEKEVDRLHGLEKTTSLVEETETCLMDRVLDLEEKEQLLLNELTQLKKIFKLCNIDQSNGQVSHDSLLDRLKYLEKKNEMLQDAEGRYMDKIVELEELQHRLQSEILTMRSSGDSSHSTNSSTNPPVFISTDSILLSMQNPGSNKKGTSSTLQTSSQSVSTDTSDLWHSPVETFNNSEALQSISELKHKIKLLTSDCEEKTSKVMYLEEKCELLRDSEAKLMEKLLENDESVSKNNNSIDNDASELKKRLDNLVEENEFLAESVENFKQLYKEEKEKTNDLHDRLMESSSIVQELNESKSDLTTAQQMVEEIQSEYEEQLSEREENITHLSNLLKQSQQREKDLQNRLTDSQQREEDLEKKLSEVVQDGSDVSKFGKIKMKDNNVELLQQLEANLKTSKDHEKELLKQIEFLQTQLIEYKDNTKHIENELHIQLNDIRKEGEELIKQRDHLAANELNFEETIRTLRLQEQDLLNQVNHLKKQLEDTTAKLLSCEGPEEASIHSDSGMSADEMRSRYYNCDKNSSEESLPVGSSPLTTKVFSSSLTLNLTQQLTATSKSTANNNEGVKSLSQEPIPPPRSRSRHRQSSIDSASQEELMFQLEELQSRESALKKRISELEAVSDTDLSYKIEELQLVNQNLQRRLNYAESQLNKSFSGSPTELEVSKDIVFIGSTTDSHKAPIEKNIEDSIAVKTNIVSLNSSPNMLEKPEDVLHKRIKELENLDKHNKIQMSELEKDREMLHEIARKDKATMHDLNVRIRELQLSERSLKEQVNSLETSESSLFTKCEDLESTKVKLEDRIHELSVHERRLRELVRKLKLDEEHWLSKSGGMETAVAELAAHEQQLKRLLQDVEMEKGGLSEKADYLEARIQELENVETTLLQRLKNSDSIEVNLQNKLIHMENSERVAYSKASELDVLNLDLSQRLQKALEENVVLTQHISQLQGQIHELDRRLLSSQDSELAYKQHMESLQKNESSLQKKVREYELREIDSQARVRELEQITDILNDKLAALQRSENRLKSRIQELESSLEQKGPQEMEESKKDIEFLQSKVESLQLQLREALKTTKTKLASKIDDSKRVSMHMDDYRQLQTKAALLEETMYQMEEVENVNKELSETVQSLRQGKGASGHEVEIEVLKRRLASYKTFINKLKSSLSMGQATSLWDPELDSGLQGDALPSRQIHGLESERVLQSVRGLHEEKAETSKERGAQLTGLTSEKDTIVKSKATIVLSSQPAIVDADDNNGSIKPEQPSGGEESHWKAIEARKPKLVASSRGGAIATVGMVAKQAPPTHPDGGKLSLTTEVEEVMIGIHLQSESELSSHTRTTQNDTDSSNSPVPPPRRMRGHRAGKSKNINNKYNSSGNESSDGTLTESDTPALTTLATNKKHFDDKKSLPSSANKYTSKERTQKQAPLTHFGEDSFYLPSSTQEGVDSLDDGEAPPLPSSGPPDDERLVSSHQSTDKSGIKTDLPEKLKSSLSIRDRIAMIERQHLHTDNDGDKAADSKTHHWRKKTTSEGLKQADLLEKDNKTLKDDINRLEKELEEKHRYFHLLELWLSNLEELLMNKNRQTDRQMVEQLNEDMAMLRSDLKNVGYRSEDAILDPAALKTELEHKDKEILFKKNEIDLLTDQLKHSQQECRNTEVMRQNTLDCLRALELELLDLQDMERNFHETQAELQSLREQTEKTKEVYEENLILRDHIHQNEAELLRLRNLCDDYNNLSARYDEIQNYKQQAVNMLEPLQSKLDRLARKCQEKDALLLRLGSELRRCTYRPSSALDDLEDFQKTINKEEYNTDFPITVNGSNLLTTERYKSHSPLFVERLEPNYSHSDTDCEPSKLSKKRRPAPYANIRPRSAEPLGFEQRFQQGAHAHPRSFLNIRSSSAHPQFMGTEAQVGHFVAVADYDPALFSQSGRPGLELELTEGDIVHVTCPTDKSGYNEAEVNGRVGLVPASYLQPVHHGSHKLDNINPSFYQQQQSHRPSHGDDRLITSYQEPYSKIKDNQIVYRGRENGLLDPGKVPQTREELPDPPTDLHVKNIVNERSILLSWLPPKLDRKGCTRGVKLLGFMVFVNNEEYMKILSPKICEIVIENLDLGHPHHLAVQSVCTGGNHSQWTEVIFEGVLRMAQEHNERTPGSEENLDTDLSPVLSNVHYKRGHRKTVIALYDYNPDQQSPLDYTYFELAFQAGQILHVYGEPRPDGFFHGEIDGKRGLVPACFVEERS